MEHQKTTKFQRINSKIIRRVTNENDKEIPKERHTSPEERQKLMII